MAASPRAKTHSALASPSRVALIDQIREADAPLDAHQLADVCNLHVTTVRFHLDALINAGLITSQPAPSRGRGRPRLLYAPVTQASNGGGDGYEELSRLLLDALTAQSGDSAAERAEAAGRTWAGRRLVDRDEPEPPGRHALENAAPKINALFTELGFEPDFTAPAPAEDLDFTLHACPFGTVAKDFPEVVCRIHLGLLRGALDRLGAGDHRAGIEPWTTPITCHARVSSTVIDASRNG